MIQDQVLFTQLNKEQLFDTFREIVKEELRQHHKIDLDEKEWLTTKETMALLKISGPTLWNYDKQGRTIPHYIGNRKRYRKSDILGILRKKEQKRS